MFFALGSEIPSHKEAAEIARTIFIIDHKSCDGAHNNKEPEEIILEKAQAADMRTDIVQEVLSLDDLITGYRSPGDKGKDRHKADDQGKRQEDK